MENASRRQDSLIETLITREGFELAVELHGRESDLLGQAVLDAYRASSLNVHMVGAAPIIQQVTGSVEADCAEIFVIDGRDYWPAKTIVFLKRHFPEGQRDGVASFYHPVRKEEVVFTRQLG